MSSMGKNVSALDSTRVIQTVGSKCAPRTAKFADCPRCTIWTNKRSRSKPFQPDRTTPQDKWVPGGHVGACFVGFGGQTRQKTRLEVGHSGSSAGKKVNSTGRRVAWFLPSFFLKNAKRRRFDKNRDFFANFQFSPPTFSFVQYYSLIDPKTSDLMQFSPGLTSSSAPELRAFCNMVLGLGFIQFHP